MKRQEFWARAFFENSKANIDTQAGYADNAIKEYDARFPMEHGATNGCSNCALEKERDELRTMLGAWQAAFGTTQLTHALARLEAAEKKQSGDSIALGVLDNIIRGDERLMTTDLERNMAGDIAKIIRAEIEKRRSGKC